MPSRNQTPRLYALYTVFFVLALLAAVARLLSRRIARLSLWWDDYFILAATTVHTVGFGFLINTLYHGGGKHLKDIPSKDVRPYLQMTFANEFVYVLTVSTAQISVLCFYLRLFQIHKTFARTVYVFIVVVVSWSIALFFSSLFQCTPVSLAFAEIPDESHCVNYRKWLVGSNIPHIVIDFSILCLPLHQVWQLSLSRLQKFGLTGVFLLGTFTSTISIIRTYFNSIIAISDPTWDFTPVQVWSSLEGWVSVICACLPSLAPLVRLLCGGQRLGMHRSTPIQIHSPNGGPRLKNNSRRKDDSTFSKLEEDQVELFNIVNTRPAAAKASCGQQHKTPLQSISITNEFDVRSDLRV